MRQITELPNKIRVVTQEFKDRGSVSVGVWVAAGGRYETLRNKGVAHFIEHMAFKGSAKYSCDEIKQLIEGVGGSVNAFTTEEETCYYAKVPVKHLRQAFNVLADIAFFPNIGTGDLDKERTVILEEIKMYHDQPQSYVVELLEALLWPNHPLGQNLAGTQESVGSMTADDLKDFKKAHYIPANTVISVCGPMKHEAMVKAVQAKLGKLKGPQPPPYIPARRFQSKSAAYLYPKATEQMHLALGFLAYEVNHQDYYTQSLMSIILGGNMSSRLFNEVREKRGLAYSISSGTRSFHDTGVFMVCAGVDNAKIVAALALVLKVLEGVCRNGVTDDEFQRAQDYYIGQFTLGLEDTLQHMLWMGGGVISRDKAKSMADVIKKIKAVTPSDVQRVACEILNPRKLNVSVIGPLTGEQRIKLSALASVA